MESVQGSTGGSNVDSKEEIADEDRDSQVRFKKHFDGLYAKLDVDGNGVISKEEMLFIIKEMIGL